MKYRTNSEKTAERNRIRSEKTTEAVECLYPPPHIFMGLDHYYVPPLIMSNNV